VCERCQNADVDRGRLEAFSDAVIAIIITIMVLELGVPDGTTWEALQPLIPVFLTYLVSFIYVAIYWNNHHHLLKTAHRVTSGIMWSNMALLFCLSLFPFATGWMGENHAAPVPTFFYGVVLLGAAIAYFVLQNAIVRSEGGTASPIADALGADWKGRLSPVAYLAAMGLAFVVPALSICLYVAVAVAWLIPDRRLQPLGE
jgi:uncharacterized membrane protein